MYVCMYVCIYIHTYTVNSCSRQSPKHILECLWLGIGLISASESLKVLRVLAGPHGVVSKSLRLVLPVLVIVVVGMVVGMPPSSRSCVGFTVWGSTQLMLT